MIVEVLGKYRSQPFKDIPSLREFGNYVLVWFIVGKQGSGQKCF
jgi:hypothetical protein